MFDISLSDTSVKHGYLKKKKILCNVAHACGMWQSNIDLPNIEQGSSNTVKKAMDYTSVNHMNKLVLDDTQGKEDSFKKTSKSESKTFPS